VIGVIGGLACLVMMVGVLALGIGFGFLGCRFCFGPVVLW